MFEFIIVPLILALWGVLVKYWPPLQGIKNNLIVWINMVLAILLKLSPAGPDVAEAGAWTAVAAGLGWLLPVVQTILARLAYETFGRPTLDAAGVKKSDYDTDDKRFDRADSNESDS